ncbi:MAG: ShlB/FhaC/HecB family hemolysin secretion/activation protein [Cyanobacteria bacterium]|nr:ShlB/FhaC/HecB family hemolysin secretion/activation protein [Cyanobacteriota bacterium]MDW8199655.1 ShlB/FhaC/HecB family hemolysin secretion/activation protein [Cyanobacteriota bacterium SKYGB_h_bin112]
MTRQLLHSTLLVVSWFSLCLALTGRSQTLEPLPAIPPGTIEPVRPPLPSLPEAIPSTSPHLTIPTSPSVPLSPLPAVRVRVKDIEVLGSTVFSRDELAKVLAPFQDRDASFEELLAIRAAVTDLYVSRGYVTSGAFLPAQQIDDVNNAVIRIQVVEGEVEQIQLQGLTRLSEAYVRDRLSTAIRTPLNLRNLEAALQLLQLDPLIASVQAELGAGLTPGRNVLKVTLQEADPWTGIAVVQNRESPSVGSLGSGVVLSYGNLMGGGDRLSADINLTAGSQTIGAGYELPVNAQDGRLSFRYTNSNSRIIEQPFSRSDINSRTQTISVGFRQPIVRTPSSEIGLGLSLDWRENQTFLLNDIPFSFSIGPENGRSAVTVLRFTQDWVNRTPTQVLAARSQFSLGLGLLGATVNNSGTDGQFISWLGQFQWVQAISGDAIVITRVAAQLTGDSLLPIEQFGIGGVDTVRGYRQNQRVGDSGIIGSIEVRVPIVRNAAGESVLQLTPFFDIGTVWSNRNENGAAATLASIGTGLRWQINPTMAARLDIGIPLLDATKLGNSLQDSGIYFSLQYQPF